MFSKEKQVKLEDDHEKENGNAENCNSGNCWHSSRYRDGFYASRWTLCFSMDFVLPGGFNSAYLSLFPTEYKGDHWI